MNKDNQQENTMRERYWEVNIDSWCFDTKVSHPLTKESVKHFMTSIIEKETALARKQAIEECIGSVKEVSEFADSADTLKQRTLQALSDIKDK